MKAKERNDLIISYVTITVAFSLVVTRLNLWNPLNTTDLLTVIPVIAVTVGLGFILHEMAHRAAAKHYGLHAEYRAWSFGLVLAVILALVTGFVFAAPGAVYIFGKEIDRRKNGIISYAGPLTNIVLGCLFILLGLALPKVELISTIVAYGAGVNFFLALFNLIPIPPLDGSKVFVWSKAVWAVSFIALIAAVFFVGF